MAKLATRAALEGVARKSVDVEIAGVDGAFRLRELSGTERDRFEVAAFKESTEMVDGKAQTRRTVDPLYLRARLVALCLVGEDGVRLYADDEVAMLSDNTSSAVLGQLFEAAQKLNGLDAAAVETARGNSPSAPEGASTSG